MFVIAVYTQSSWCELVYWRWPSQRTIL